MKASVVLTLLDADDAVAEGGHFRDKTGWQPALEAKDRHVAAAQAVFVKRHHAENVEAILAAEFEHRGNWAVMEIGFDENARAAALGGGHADEGLEEIGFRVVSH